MRIDDLVVGQTAGLVRTVTQEMIAQFASATGDHNPLHMDPATAAGGPFGTVVAHGMLTAGFVSAAIASELPGPGSVYLAQSLRFLRPVRPGDEIRIELEVLSIAAARRRVTLATRAWNQDGAAVLTGEAEILVPA